jgi:uncharacterized protein
MESTKRRWGCVVGFDDGPSMLGQTERVLLVGAVCARTRLDQIVTSTVERDGTDATDVLIDTLANPGLGHVRAVLLGGISVAGRNVVDATRLSNESGLPVLVVARRAPKPNQMREMLLTLDDDVQRQEAIEAVERLGPMEQLLFGHRPESGLPCEVWVQRVGLKVDEARALLTSATLTGNMPEALRLAHIIAGGVVDGLSRGRA